MAITKIDTDMIANDAITADKIVAGALDTQLAGYLSTNSFATESYVGTAISNLVDSSPATLDTLNELAAALGDDPNFATTTATAIGLKAPLASPSFTGAATFSGNVGVGSSDFGNGGTLNLSVGVAGVTSGGLQLWASPAQTHYMQFGDSTAGGAPYSGAVGYNHATDSLLFLTAGSSKLTIASTGAATFSGAVTASTGNVLASTGDVETGYGGKGYLVSMTNIGPKYAIRSINNTEKTLFINDSAGGFTNIKTYTDGVLRTTLDANGNLGIGTITPSSKLTVDSGTTNTAYSPTSFNTASQIKINVASTQNNYAGIQFTHAGNTEGFIGFVRTSTTASDADFVIQSYTTSVGYTEKLRIDNSGIVTMPYQPRFIAYGASSGYIPGTYSQSVIFPTVANTSGHYSTSTGLFTAPVTGTYLFQGSIYSTTTANWSQAWLTINGVRGSYTDVISGDAFLISTTHLVDLTAGDTVGYHPYTQSGTYSIAASVYHTYFKGRLLG